jgi:hypothetical protein
MNPQNSAKNTKSKLLTIVGWAFLFFASILLFSSFMNRQTLDKFTEKGVPFFGTISDKTSYKAKTSSKSSYTEKFMIKVDFNFKGLPGSIYLSEFISEDEADAVKVGERVEILYLPKSEFVSNNKISFVTTPIMKKTLENALKVNKNFFILGGIIFVMGIIFLVIKRFLK